MGASFLMGRSPPHKGNVTGICIFLAFWGFIFTNAISTFHVLLLIEGWFGFIVFLISFHFSFLFFIFASNLSTTNTSPKCNKIRRQTTRNVMPAIIFNYFLQIMSYYILLDDCTLLSIWTQPTRRFLVCRFKMSNFVSLKSIYWSLQTTNHRPPWKCHVTEYL